MKRVEENERHEEGFPNEDKSNALIEHGNDGEEGATQNSPDSFGSQVADMDNKRRQMVRQKRFRRWYTNHRDLAVEEQPQDPEKVELLQTYGHLMYFVSFDDEWVLL